MIPPTRFTWSRAILPLVAIAVGLLSGCGGGSASSSSARSYPVTSSGAVDSIEHGTVISVRRVKVDGRSTVYGQVIGAGVGAAVGSIVVPPETTITQTEVGPGIYQVETSSNSAERAAAMIVGGAVGTVVGPQVEKALTARTVQEVAVAMEDGETKIILQEIREPEFLPDEKVKVVTKYNGDVLVYHMDEDPGMNPETNAYLVGEDGEESFEEVTW